MQTAIQGKEIETTYSVKTVRNERGVLTKKPELVKESKVVKWDNLFVPIDGKIATNTVHTDLSHFNFFSSTVNISENEEVVIEGQIYRADIDTVMLHTGKVVSEKEINKAESETEFKKVIAEYNHTVVDNNPKMKAYCNVNKIDIDTVDIDDLKKICGEKCNTLYDGVAITSDYGNEYSLSPVMAAITNGITLSNRYC